MAAKKSAKTPAKGSAKASKRPVPANDVPADVAAANESEPQPRKPGRPRGRFDDSIDWEAIANAYVWGDDIQAREDGSFKRVYPSFKTLGEKFGVTPSLVHYYAKREKWADRRLDAASKTRNEYDNERAKARVRETVNASEVLDVWLGKFAENVEAGKVRADSITDLNVVVRLKKFLQGEADSRAEQRVVVSLEQLQVRHREIRGRTLVAEGPVAGVLSPDDDARLRGELPDDDGQAHEDEEGGDEGAQR